MRTTNWERCASLERLLARCEEYRDRLEAMPDGKPLTGVAIDLPPLWNGSRQRLVADARSALEAVAPLAAVFRARGITDYDELPRWIAWLDEAMEAHASRGPGGAAMSDALRKGAEAAVGLQPLFLAAVHGDYYRAAEWSKVRWTGPARARTRKARAAEE